MELIIKDTEKPLMLHQYKVVLFVLVFGSISATVGFITVRNAEHQHVYYEITEAAQEQIRAFQNTTDNALEMLHTFAAFYATSPQVDRHQFNSLAMPVLLRHSYFLALIWVPRVPHAQRADYEMSAQRVHPQFRFTEQTPQGDIVTVSARKVYFPAYYVVSLKPIERAYGFDFHSNYSYLQALTQAQDTKTLQATSRV